MKILLVSMKSIHFRRWTAQLEHSGHEVFYFDISGKVGALTGMPWLQQKRSWKYRWDFPGRYTLKKTFPKIYKLIQPLNERRVDKVFEAYLKEIRPDVVHSFALYVSCSPILKVMELYPRIKWVYSSWGSDLFYFQHDSFFLNDIKAVLPRVDYMFSDCNRDIVLAQYLGFKGQDLGVFPGGGGYDLKAYNSYVVTPIENRKLILVKGYQGRSGRCITVLKALLEMKKKKLSQYRIVLFGADVEVVEFVKSSQFDSKINVEIYTKEEPLEHKAILKLMGQSIIYIGNSNSDGIPNTLLEAVIMGAFPIQSNPGGASAEIIIHGENGLLIEDCNDIMSIKNLILNALSDRELLECAFYVNQKNVKPQLEINSVRTKVLEAYNSIKY